MAVREIDLTSYRQSLAAMYDMVRKYSSDLAVGGLSRLTLRELFDRLRTTPFIPDKEGTETVARPLYIIEAMGAGEGLDCKKKSILLASWLRENGMPDNAWRFACVSHGPIPIHHVFVQVQSPGGDWLNLDPTESRNRMYEPQAITRLDTTKPEYAP